MKVLHITARADHGGAPENTLRLISESRHIAEHYIASPREHPYWNRYANLLGNDRLIEIPHRHFSPAALLRLHFFCRERSFDLLHSHGFGAGIYSRPVAFANRIPCVHTFHGFFHHLESGYARWLKLLVETSLAPLTRQFVAVSFSEAEAVSRRLRGSSGKLTVIANGVDPGHFRPSEVPVDQGAFNVAAVCRLDPHKNPMDLLRTVRHYCELYPDSLLHLSVAGDGPMRAELEAEIARMGLESRVTLLGWQSDVRDLLQSSHAYLSVSKFEGLSLSMLEAMACGLPVIATIAQGHTDLISHGSNGFLFLKGDTRSAAEYIHRLESSAGLRLRLSSSARRTIKTSFTLAGFVSKHEILYNRVCGRQVNPMLAGNAVEDRT